MVRHNQIGDMVSYDQLYDSLVQFEPHVQASKVKRAIRNHDPLTLIAHSNASSSHSHANPSSSHSPQPYYVTHPSSVKFSTLTNNRLHTSSNSRNQALIQDGRVDIQTKNAGYGGNGKANVQCYNCNEKGHYARDCPKPRFHDAKYFREQMLLAMKDEAGSNLNDEENDFMLDNSFRYEALEEITAAVIMMSQIQPTADNGVQKRNYDAKAVSEVNASYKMIPKWVHEHKNQGKRKTVINTYDDNQIDFNIIFDDPYVENNGGSDEHDSTAHDQYHVVKILAYNALREAKNKKRLNNELKKQKMLLQKELETSIKAFKEREDRYLEDIVDLEEKMSSHDRIVYKIGQSIQTIHMLGKIPKQVYDPFLKAGLGFKNPDRLKKVIPTQPKIYHGEKVYSTKLKIDSPRFEETLEDTEKSRLKMRNKMVQLDYNKLNALYETFVPQKESSVDQTYFSIPSTSNDCSKTKEITSDLPIPKNAKRE
ncbi:putative ribonuclease H-like domain-containing protein [Tanacetum coccineum]